MPVVGPDGTRMPDYQNPAAVRYARMRLQQLVRQGLIDSVAGAAAHYGGDVTATWRALSGLTGAPHTTTLAPTAPVPPQPLALPVGPVRTPGPMQRLALAAGPQLPTGPPYEAAGALRPVPGRTPRASPLARLLALHLQTQPYR